MKGFLKKFKNPKFLVLAVIFLSLVFFSPFNSQAANNPIRVTEVQSSALGGITQWVTDSVLQTMDPTDWVKTGGEKFVDPSTIQNGVLQPTGSNWIVSLAKAIAGYIINSILAVIYLVLWVVYSIAY